MHYITVRDIQCNVMHKAHSPLQCKPSNAKSPQKGQIFAHLYSIDWIFTFTHIALCFKNNNFLCRFETNTRIIEDIPLWSSLTIIEIAKSDNKGKGRKTAQSMMHTAQRAKYFVVLTVWSKYDGHSTAHWSSVNKKILDVLGRLTTFRSDAIHFTVLHSISLKCRT